MIQEKLFFLCFKKSRKAIAAPTMENSGPRMLRKHIILIIANVADNKKAVFLRFVRGKILNL